MSCTLSITRGIKGDDQEWGTEDVKKKNAMSGESIITASFRTTSCAPAMWESS
jgi:hypothetical protein